MAKVPAMPAPWNRTKQKGRWYRPIEGGNLVFEPAAENWKFEVARGTSAETTDLWGGWRGCLEDEAAVIDLARDLLAKLAKAGWTTMKISDAHAVQGMKEENEKAMLTVLAKLSRSTLIPVNLLRMLDSARAAEGKAVAGDVLRVAAQDIHFEKLGSGWWNGMPSFTAWLTVQDPGVAKRRDGGKRLVLDVHGLDALIDYLVDARKGMVTLETFREINEQLGSSIGVESNAERVAMIRDRSDAMSALHAELSDTTLEQLETVLIMTQMIKSGDMTVDFIRGAAEEPAAALH